ncbi:MAG: LicD family protein [Clostridiales bacterium]|nr:LicD family protein [Clostridiales bacterium]
MANEIGLEELKRIELNVLCQIREICNEQNIKYFLDGGTLLGAIRHGGFIPWDDDIDICMPRPDYNRFIEYCKNHYTPFGLASHQTDFRFTELYAKAYDRDTICEEIYVNRSRAEYGVYVDIFPLDGLGNSQKQALKLLHKSRFKRSLLKAANWRSYFKSKTRKWYVEPVRFLFFILSRLTNPAKLVHKIEKIYKDIPYEGSEKVGVVCGLYDDKEIMDYSIFKNIIEVEFENEQFAILERYDEFLTNLYGDYMKLPPPEKRVTHHTFKAYKRFN